MKEKSFAISVTLSLAVHLVALALCACQVGPPRKLRPVTVVELVRLQQAGFEKSAHLRDGSTAPVRKLDNRTVAKPQTLASSEKSSDLRQRESLPDSKPQTRELPHRLALPKKVPLTPAKPAMQELDQVTLPSPLPVSSRAETMQAPKRFPENLSTASSSRTRDSFNAATTPNDKREEGGADLAGSATNEGPGEVPVAYAGNPLPKYPRIARRKGWEGKVWLHVRVSAVGLVEEVTVERSSGYKSLDRAALKAVQHWRFYPVHQGLIPVAGEARVPVRFEIQES
jgi:TonB family protein